METVERWIAFYWDANGQAVKLGYCLGAFPAEALAAAEHQYKASVPAEAKIQVLRKYQEGLLQWASDFNKDNSQ